MNAFSRLPLIPYWVEILEIFPFKLLTEKFDRKVGRPRTIGWFTLDLLLYQGQNIFSRKRRDVDYEMPAEDDRRDDQVCTGAGEAFEGVLVAGKIQSAFQLQKELKNQVDSF